MATQNEHGGLIAAAAKSALAPIGCVRRGQSRVWLSDQRYWAIMIEFQPSGFSTGAYLNVGASWLWYDRGNRGLAFNVGNRVEHAGFIPFENAEQFRPLIEKMAARAAAEVLALRAKFPSIDAISRFLNAEPDTGDLRRIHPAIAAGLNGEFDVSRRVFERIREYPIDFDWEVERKSEAATLAALLDDPAQFRAAVRRTIDRSRMRNHLPPIDNCLEGVESSGATTPRSQ